MAQAQIIGGYKAGEFLWDTGSTVHSGMVRGMGGRSLAGRVASVQIVSEAQKKSFLQATATGLAGAALAGPVGAVAGVVAGGNRKEVLFSCRLRAGGEFIAKGDSRIFELLLAESMKPQAKAQVLVGTTATAQVTGGHFGAGADLRLNKGLVKLYSPAEPPLLVTGKWKKLERLVSSAPGEERFSCLLRDGRSFEAQGDAQLFEALGKGGSPKFQVLVACFVGAITLAIVWWLLSGSAMPVSP